MSTWQEIGEKWRRAQQMGWQAIQAAMDVGEELTQKKTQFLVCLSEKDQSKQRHGEMSEFRRRAGEQGIGHQRASELMRLALHRDLIEEHKPDSLRQALALLPKVPTRTSEKQITAHKEEIDKYESFAKETAKKQAQILARKKVKVELEQLQNEAHESVMKELKAVKKQLAKERERLGRLMEEAAEKEQHYKDLISKRMNGYDYKMGLKILRQAVHPDRDSASEEVKRKAMDAINHIARFLQV